MIPTGAKTSQFNLLFLDEGELYIKDYQGKVQLIDPKDQQLRKEEAVIHFCSHSLMIEGGADDQCIWKYYFKFMTSPPALISYKKMIKIEISRIIVIPMGPIPSAYEKYDLEKSTLKLELLYSPIHPLFNALNKFYEQYQLSKVNFDYMQAVEEWIEQDELFTNAQFNKTRIKSINEKPLVGKDFRVRLILPLVFIDGIFYMTNERIYFQSIHSIYTKQVQSMKLACIRKVFKRRYRLLNVGLELTDTKNKSLYLAFQNVEIRESFYALILENVNPKCETERSINESMSLWIQGKMSNYDYLMHLNSAAYRSFADISQYPVFPWVITEFNKSSLDLEDPKIYRDLGKPIGAINPERLKEFQSRFARMEDGERFMYGTHYSTPGYIIGFLLRKHPRWMLKLQSGHFDNPNRLFKSIPHEWKMVNDASGNVKELIPEFFMEDSSFLLNKQQLDLGLATGNIQDVELPKWAKTSEEFLRIQREALESSYVSANLHKWIDLIFGFQQREPNSIEANNVFHPMTYEGYIDLANITDPAQKCGMELQIQEFGQTPKQIFFRPHPHKYSFQKLTPGVGIPAEEEGKEEEKEVIPKGILVIFDRVMGRQEAHAGSLTSLQILEGDAMVITTSKDGKIKLFSINDHKTPQKRAYHIVDPGISCSAILHQAKAVALGSYDNNIYLYDYINGVKIDTLFGHDDTITGVLISNKTNQLLSISDDATIKIWEGSGKSYEPEPIAVIYDHENQIRSADLFGTLLVTLDIDGHAIFRDLEEAESQIGSFRITPDSKKIFIRFLSADRVVIAYNNLLELYDIEGRIFANADFQDNINYMERIGHIILISKYI